jgi:hypothetical protein
MDLFLILWYLFQSLLYHPRRDLRTSRCQKVAHPRDVIQDTLRRHMHKVNRRHKDEKVLVSRAKPKA